MVRAHRWVIGGVVALDQVQVLVPEVHPLVQDGHDQGVCRIGGEPGFGNLLDESPCSLDVPIVARSAARLACVLETPLAVGERVRRDAGNVGAPACFQPDIVEEDPVEGEVLGPDLGSETVVAAEAEPDVDLALTCQIA